MTRETEAFWSLGEDDLLAALAAGRAGLSAGEAARRLDEHGPNRLRPARRTSGLYLFLTQFTSPIVLLLLFAAGLALYLRESTNALLVLAIVFVSGVLSFWQQYHAERAMARLQAMVRAGARVRRDGAEREVPVAEVVPGDIVILSAGDLVPADCRLLDANGLCADEAHLTGESYPVEKRPGVLAPETPLARRTNTLFMGTYVTSGTGTAVAVLTGRRTAIGGISERLARRAPETQFERGVRRFGYLLLEVTLLLVLAVFAVNVYFHRPVLESFLFSLALAVGLTPQLLPAIIGVNLAQGARRMAREKVIVKRLASIENIGAMDVLCVDKTGTLTEGVMRLHAALGVDGRPRDRVAFFAYLNAYYQGGFRNPIDAAVTAEPRDTSGWRPVAEVPYDFVRKRLSVLMADPGGRRWLITKGALDPVLAVCTRAELPGGEAVPLEQVVGDVRRIFAERSMDGFRILGVACRDGGERDAATAADEAEMTFLGFLLFFDPPKPEAVEAVRALKALGVSFKMITGDNRHAARYIWREVGLPPPRLVTGEELRRTSGVALPRLAAATDVFAEVDPVQKERIVLALRRAGHVVGYLGDGINDGAALHAADVGVSVSSAVDVAREAATLVLLEKDLHVLQAGVVEGRRTFANTLKYIFMATSANFGNMFSMAGASLFLPFLPLLPHQILLNNLITDTPEMAIAGDTVDGEMVARPRRWDLRFIRRFMLVFGLLSSVFDYLTFGVLLWGLHASVAQFRTGWFQESVISAALIVLVIRTRHPFFRSRPAPLLARATAAVVLAALVLPYTPLAPAFNFTPLPPVFLAALGGVLVLYVAGAEAVKKLFYRRFGNDL